jgi:hypothetical protein
MLPAPIWFGISNVLLNVNAITSLSSPFPLPSSISLESRSAVCYELPSYSTYAQFDYGDLKETDREFSSFDFDFAGSPSVS